MVELAALALSVALAAQQPAIEPVPVEPDVAAETAALPGEQGASFGELDALDDAASDFDSFELTDESAAAERTAGFDEIGEADNPYGLNQLWSQGDFVARGTLIILIGMSFVSWFIILTKIWDQSRLRRQFGKIGEGFWSGKSLRDGVTTLTDSNNTFRLIAEAGLSAAEQHTGYLTDKIPREEWISTSLQRAVEKVINNLQSGLSFLATAGSTAPFIGLFGTVWGIYHALIAIGVAGQASIDKVAGPVGEALIMTALGLVVAVPAVLGYNWLQRRNRGLIEQMRYFASDIEQYLVGNAGAEASPRGN